jgi:hypothetical protein
MNDVPQTIVAVWKIDATQPVTVIASRPECRLIAGPSQPVCIAQMYRQSGVRCRTVRSHRLGTEPQRMLVFAEKMICLRNLWKI